MPDDAVAAWPRPTVVWPVLAVLWALPAVLLGAYGEQFALLAVVFLIGLPLGVIWCVFFAQTLCSRKARGRLTAKAVVAWAIFPATGLLLVALCLSPWTLVLRVKLSEPALLRLVEEVEAGRAKFDPPVRAGLFKIDGGRVEGGCVFLETNEGWPLASEGIAYVREGARSWGLSGHLTGRWWAFYFPD